VLPYREGKGFEDSPRASWPRREGGDGCEDPASELHTCIKGRLSRRLEISSMCDWLGGGGTTSSLGLGCKGSVCFTGSVGLVTGAFLGPTMNLGSDFAVLPFLLVSVTSLHVGVSVIGPELCWGSVGEAAVTTQPPWTMWFQPVLGSPA